MSPGRPKKGTRAIQFGSLLAFQLPPCSWTAIEPLGGVRGLPGGEGASQGDPLLAAQNKPALGANELRGLKDFKARTPLLEHRPPVGTERDKAGNRQRFFDQDAALILLYVFNPIRTSLRSLQPASGLNRVPRRLGSRATARGALSEAARVVDAAVLPQVLTELAGRGPPAATPAQPQALKDLTAGDGSLLPPLPRLAWALWLDDSHRAANRHLAFEVRRGIPLGVTVTAGKASEYDQLSALLQAGRLYVIDRGHAEYQWFQDRSDAKSAFSGRLRDNAVWTGIEERPVSAAAWAAGCGVLCSSTWAGRPAARSCSNPCGSSRWPQARPMPAVSPRGGSWPRTAWT